MFVWLDRNTFKLDGKLHMINFCNVALIGVYGCKEGGYEIRAKFNNGDMYIGGCYAELDQAEKAFLSFIEARPSDTQIKGRIKIT